MMDRFGIFGAVIRIRKLSLLLVVTLRMPNKDLEITFGCLHTNNIKLNPKKCVFGVPRGMLLGYMVS